MAGIFKPVSGGSVPGSLGEQTLASDLLCCNPSVRPPFSQGSASPAQLEQTEHEQPGVSLTLQSPILLNRESPEGQRDLGSEQTPLSPPGMVPRTLLRPRVNAETVVADTGGWGMTVAGG